MRKSIFFATTILLTLLLTSCSHSENFIKNNNFATKKNTLTVLIANGTILSPTTHTPQNYHPLTFTIKNGDCVKTNIVLNSNENVNLKNCLKENVLFIDTEKSGIIRTNQTVRFYFNSLWQQGYTYQNITTNGQAHLMNVDVKIKILN